MPHPQVFITDSHHKVLEAWAKYRQNSNSAPRLITLDHHTDTSEPFRRHIFKKHLGLSLKTNESKFRAKQKELLNQIDYKNKLSILSAIENLNNDEHIIAAQKVDIVSEVFVIAHNAATTSIDTFNHHQIICYSVPEFIQDGKSFFKNDLVLESSFLNEAFKHFEDTLKKCKQAPLTEKAYILDIDLDYFNSFKSCEPKDSSFIKKLIKGADLITIATEPDYVESCAVDKDLTSRHLEARILSLIQATHS